MSTAMGSRMSWSGHILLIILKTMKEELMFTMARLQVPQHPPGGFAEGNQQAQFSVWRWRQLEMWTATATATS